MSRPGHRDERAVVRDAVLLVGLRRRHLEVAARTAASCRRCRRSRWRPTSSGSVARQRGARAAAPLVGEDHLGAVVVERRRVPVGEVLVGDVRRGAPGSPDRRCRAGCRCRSTRRRAGRRPGYTVMSWHWLVTRARLRARPVVAALPEARRSRRSSRPRRCAARLTIAAFSGVRERHLDHVDAEERRVRVLFGRLARAARRAPRPSGPAPVPEP